ncbi:MAG: hypothetical protein OXU86_04215 [Thaumarchaeota archaeon]|nr:hypothetical protein [Nitrososphaerota archaeon]
MRSPHVVAPAIAFGVLIFTVAWAWFYEGERPPCVGSTEAAMCWQGHVTRVIDGDTLDIDNTRIRLVLVDAPERGEDGHGEATALLASLCPVGARAAVDVDDAQRGGSHGRAIATVACESDGTATVANAEMVKSDHASVYGEFCKTTELTRHGNDTRTAWAREACAGL